MKAKFLSSPYLEAIGGGDPMLILAPPKAIKGLEADSEVTTLETSLMEQNQKPRGGPNPWMFL